MDRTITMSCTDVQLVLDENLDQEAFASVTLNPNVTWAKFVLLDDQPNGNKHRVPKEEFANVIRTGVHMPIKSADVLPRKDHQDAKPLGVITHLQEQENTIIGLAALWIKERKEDIATLKSRFSEGKSVDVSWELSYGDSVTDEDGTVTFKDVIMNAATIVGIPAYKGRTPFIAMASEDSEDNENLEEINMEQISKEEHDRIVSELNTKITELETKGTELASEVASLTEFKEKVQAAEAKQTKLNELKEKFVTAGLELNEDYLTQNEEKLLAMEPEVLDFFIQELVAFASKEPKQETASLVVTSKVPNLDSQKPQKKSLVDQLREYDAKK